MMVGDIEKDTGEGEHKEGHSRGRQETEQKVKYHRTLSTLTGSIE